MKYYDIVFLTEQQVQDWCVTTDDIGPYFFRVMMCLKHVYLYSPNSKTIVFLKWYSVISLQGFWVETKNKLGGFVIIQNLSFKNFFYPHHLP